MKMPIKRILQNLAILLVTALVLLGIAVYMIFKHNAYGYVASINSDARTHYNLFTNGSIDSELLHIPQNGEYIVYGECNHFSSYTAYKNEFIENDILLLGADGEATGYWALKFIDGELTAAWSANYPLESDQLQPYTWNEQQEQVPFFRTLFKKFHQTKAIGYYEKTEMNK